MMEIWKPSEEGMKTKWYVDENKVMELKWWRNGKQVMEERKRNDRGMGTK